MTHKQVKFGKGKRSWRVKHIEEEYESENVLRRAVLLSCDDVDRMAIESSRARLINHLVSKSEDHSPGEFTSYYCGSTRYLDPPYSITSHTNRVPIPKLQVIPAYPSLVQHRRWCPYAGPPSAQNSESDLMMDERFNCRCLNCTSAKCPAKYSCTLKPCQFKDNIMTFSDRYTMTLKLNDAGCGRTPIPSTPKCSDVFVPCASAMVAVRDTEGKVKIHEMFSRKSPPTPILKKGCPGPVYYDNGNKKLMSYDFQDEVVRDGEPSKAKPVTYFYRKDEDTCTEFEGDVISRKNIYNEGISDVVTDIKFPVCIKKKTPLPDCSRSSMMSKGYDSDDDNYIPHSPTSESKYHEKFTETLKFLYVDGKTQTTHHAVMPSPKVISKTYATKPCKRCKQVPRGITLPKRVLTSERVVDTCVNKHPKNNTPCIKK